MFIYRWLPQALIITILCGLVYATVQQNYRQSLNDPQIQISEDAALQLSSGVHVVCESGASSTGLVVSAYQSVPDIAQSLLPWIAVYDASGVPVAASGELN